MKCLECGKTLKDDGEFCSQKCCDIYYDTSREKKRKEWRNFWSKVFEKQSY